MDAGRFCYSMSPATRRLTSTLLADTNQVEVQIGVLLFPNTIAILGKQSQVYARHTGRRRAGDMRGTASYAAHVPCGVGHMVSAK